VFVAIVHYTQPDMEWVMKKTLILGVVLAAGLVSGRAQAFDTFIPMGFGYSTSNMQPSQLSEQDKKIIGQADIYETDIYQRQLRARETDTRMQNWRSDRNFDGTDHFPEY
jgi:hypothetical protein